MTINQHAAGLAFVVLTVLGAGCDRTPEPTTTGAPSSALSESDKARVDDFWQLFRSARDAQHRHQPELAVDRFRQALAIQPTHEDSLYYLAAALADSGHHREATTTLQRLVEVSPDHSPRGHGSLARILGDCQPGAPCDYPAATAALERQRSLNPEESGSYLALAALALHHGDLVRAEQAVELGLGLNHTSPDGFLVRGLVRFAEGDVTGARAALATAVANSAAPTPHKGVLQEGDTRNVEPDLPPAVLIARLYLEYCDRRVEGPPPSPATPPPTSLIETDAAPRDLAAADFDGDGDLDLAVVGDRTGVRLLDQDRGRWRERAGIAPALPSASGLAWGDIDGDGDPDLLLTRDRSAGPKSPTLLRNDRGRFVDVTATTSPDPARLARPVFLDVGGDGHLDLVAATGTPTTLQWFANAAGRFGPGQPLPLPTTVRPCTHIAVGDLDGDARPDLVVALWQESPRVLVQTDDGFDDVTVASGLGAVQATAVALVDLDRDGQLDLVLGRWRPLAEALADKDPGVGIWRNQSGRFQAIPVAGLAAVRPSVTAIAVLAAAADRPPELYIATGGPSAMTRLDDAHIVNRGRFDLTVVPLALDGPLPTNSTAAVTVDSNAVAVVTSGAGEARRLLMVELTRP